MKRNFPIVEFISDDLRVTVHQVRKDYAVSYIPNRKTDVFDNKKTALAKFDEIVSKHLATITD